MKRYPSFEEYRKAWDNAYHTDPDIPLNLDIELTSICNLRCPFCIITDPNYKYIAGQSAMFMPMKNAIEIINEAKSIGIPALKFNWIGEPTLHSNFNEILFCTREKGFHDIIINTNGNYKTEKNIGLMQATRVIFSIDSFDPLIYTRMRNEGNLRLVIRNVKDLLSRGHKNIVARRTITQDNKNDSFKDNALKIFGNDVTVSEHHVFDRSMMKKQTLKSKRIYCGYPSQRLIIDTNLDVYPCCVDYRRTMRLGSIAFKSIMMIWKSDYIKKIREYLRRNTMISASCKDCRSYMAYNHPYRGNLKQ
jgi:radical SAM protein with 4Fe4S-binding SPASM domain